MNPFSGRNRAMSFANLFSTHPPTEDRIERLHEIEQQIGTSPGQPLID
jgi:Zn-dependent protease with chaperone function